MLSSQLDELQALLEILVPVRIVFLSDTLPKSRCFESERSAYFQR